MENRGRLPPSLALSLLVQVSAALPGPHLRHLPHLRHHAPGGPGRRLWQHSHPPPSLLPCLRPPRPPPKLDSEQRELGEGPSGPFGPYPRSSFEVLKVNRN